MIEFFCVDEVRIVVASHWDVLAAVSTDLTPYAFC